MELTGKIIKIFPEQGGTSKNGNTYKTIDFLVETAEQYPKKALINIFGEDKVNNFKQYNREGDDVVVSLDINAREYNGRWYNDVRAWKVSKANAQPAQAAPQPAPVQSAPIPQPTPPPTQQEAQEAADALPF